MSKGFSTKEHISASPHDVWSNLTDFRWMSSIDGFTQRTEGPLKLGTVLKFNARGKERETRVTALEPDKRLALTSTQGGVTATYEYSLAPVEGGTEVTLNAGCEATGLWKLVHPVIVFAMKKADGSQLAKLKATVEHPPG